MAAAVPSIARIGQVPVSLATGVSTVPTGVRGVDPFALSPVADLQGAGSGVVLAGVGVTAAGSLALGGLEVLGARVYDPVARGFMSVDPLASPVGAGWGANVYAFVGNAPVGLVDPWGLSPMTAGEFRDYRQDSSARAWERLGGQLADGAAGLWDWTKNNWEYIAAGAAIVAGVGLMFTGVGGPAGLALIAASGALTAGGISVASQKVQKGIVDWSKVSTDALIGAATGALGGWAAQIGKAAMVSAPAGQALRAVTINAGVNGTVGGISSGTVYLAKNNWSISNPWEFAGTVSGGSISGMAGGLAGPMGGTIAQKFGQNSGGSIAKISENLINFSGGSVGSLAEDIVSGKEANFTKAGITGLSSTSSNMMGGFIANKSDYFARVTNMHGVNYMSQVPYFHPRTLTGALNLSQPNSLALWGSASSGAIIGWGTDEIYQ